VYPEIGVGQDILDTFGSGHPLHYGHGS
jgi:hypothetical protein